MLRKVGESAWPISEKDAVVSIKDASYPIGSGTPAGTRRSARDG